ncbi:MAG: C39 family peptidase [Bacilli bacterium]|nr:C39 family peptidase [Bacilli bacterium]
MILSLIDLCSEPTFLGIIFFIKQLLKIVWIIIPMGLILMAMVDLAKSVLANGTDEMAKNGKVLIKRTILCIALFLIPTFVNFLVNLMGDVVLDSDFVTCYKRAKLDTILKLSNNKDTSSNESFDDYTNSSANGSSGGFSTNTGNNSNNSSKNISNIRLDKKTLKLKVKKYKTLTAIVSPSGASNKNLTWKSSNPKVAVVNQNGKVTALKAGKTTVTVRSSNGKTAKCTVTVTSASIMKIPNIKQGDPKYFGYTFPVHSGASMAGNGCGIVSVTMVLQYLTGKNIPVETVATWADQNGHFNGIGSNGSLFGAAAQKWNVGNVTTTRNINTVIKALQKGRPVVSLQNRGLFTQAMHFIVLTGIDDKGKIHVNDPNGSHTRSVYSKREVNQNNNTYYIFDAKK